MNYKIDFKFTFFLCIVLMVFDQVWKLLEERPEAFAYGNVIYHTITTISFVFTNIAIGLAASIIFYFMAHFLSKEKNFQMYIDVRDDTHNVFYDHMTILSEIEEFKRLELKSRSGSGSSFNSPRDIPTLIEAFYMINSEEKISAFMNHLKEYFLTASETKIDHVMEILEYRVKVLKKKKDMPYFKSSEHFIRFATLMVSDTSDFPEIMKAFKSNEVSPEKREDLAEELVRVYYYNLVDTIRWYEELMKFMDAVGNKKIFTFIKMVE